MKCTTPQEPNPFRDARHILMVAQITPSLPFPSICACRATFDFTGITHAADAEAAILRASADLGKALNVSFTACWPEAATRGAARCILVALLGESPGMEINLVARSEHINPDHVRRNDDDPQSGRAA